MPVLLALVLALSTVHCVSSCTASDVASESKSAPCHKHSPGKKDAASCVRINVVDGRGFTPALIAEAPAQSVEPLRPVEFEPLFRATPESPSGLPASPLVLRT